MPRPPAPKRQRIPYWLSMLLTTAILAGTTLLFVLVILPQRFILQGGLRSSGVSFPATALAFSTEDPVMRPARIRPPEPDPQTAPPAVVPVPGPAERLWDAVTPLVAGGEPERAIPLFREYLDAYPEDDDVRTEFGIALIRAGEVAEAEAELREVIRRSAGSRARLELARLLAAGDRFDEALVVAAAIPSSAPEAVEAQRLAREILQLRAPADTEVAAGEVQTELPAPDTPERARQAVQEGDLELARSLYAQLLAESPADAELLLEWADVLQFHLDDPAEALRVLRLRSGLVRTDAMERFRIGQLLVWTGDEEGAEHELRRVVAEAPDHADAWALLGELNRWAGRRQASAEAYRTALALDPANEIALPGSEALAEDTRRAVRSVDTPASGPSLTFFSDSDGFRRTEVRGATTLLPYPGVVAITVGYRQLEGFDLLGTERTDQGGFVEVTGARWWHEGSLRGALTVGADRTALAGVEATLEARLQLVEVRGWNLQGSALHGPAHPLTSTLESVEAGLRADRIRLDLFRRLPGAIELSGYGEGVRFSGAGDPVHRTGAGVALGRSLGPWVRAGVTSRYVALSDAAPLLGERRLFWDPRSFWSNGVMLELRTPPERGPLALYLRGTPGIALARERESTGVERVGQFEAEAGLRYHRERFSLSADLFRGRGRDGGYTSRGFALGMEVRH